MIVYNVTIKIDLTVHDVWLAWMQAEHIPRVMQTGCFTQYKMYRILEQETTDGISYAIQYYANNISDYFTYQKEYAPALQKEVADTFPDKFVAFRTLLKEM
jgi:hypothetical protein